MSDMSEILNNVQIFISTPSTKTIVIEVNPSTMTVKELKKMIQKREGIDADAQRLIYRGKQMDDQWCLSDYGVENHSTIKLVLRLLG